MCPSHGVAIRTAPPPSALALPALRRRRVALRPRPLPAPYYLALRPRHAPVTWRGTRPAPALCEVQALLHLAARQSEPSPQWTETLGRWAFDSARAIRIQDTEPHPLLVASNGLPLRALRLGSAWGGWACSNPSYAAITNDCACAYPTPLSMLVYHIYIYIHMPYLHRTHTYTCADTDTDTYTQVPRARALPRAARP